MEQVRFSMPLPGVSFKSFFNCEGRFGLHFVSPGRLPGGAFPVDFT